MRKRGDALWPISLALCRKRAVSGKTVGAGGDRVRPHGWRNRDVKIADLDISQATSFHWMQRRHANATQPEIRVEGYQRLEKAANDAEHFDVMVLDGAPHATTETLRIARVANLGHHPDRHSTGRPGTTVRLAHEATKGWRRFETDGAGAETSTGDSEAETNEARAYIREAGYQVADGSLPERIAYRRASDLGNAVSETPFPSLNERARALFSSLIAPLQAQQPKENAA